MLFPPIAWSTSNPNAMNAGEAFASGALVVCLGSHLAKAVPESTLEVLIALENTARLPCAFALAGNFKLQQQQILQSPI